MVSIVITAYNYDKFIERSIRSCLEQSLPVNSYEIIVINDASTDSTSKILENYSELVRVFNLKNNVGLSAARNLGIKKARGQFIVFLDADDYIHNDLLLVQKLFLTENTTLDAVSVDYYKVDKRGNHKEYINGLEHPIACGIMFRKDFLYDTGLYDEEFRAREEEDFRIRFLKKYNIYHLEVPLYRYRIHGNNLTNDKSQMDRHKSLLNEKHNK